MSVYKCCAKLKPGDKVRIRPLHYLNRMFKKDDDGWYCMPANRCGIVGGDMLNVCGKICTVRKVYYCHAIEIDELSGYIWPAETYIKAANLKNTDE